MNPLKKNWFLVSIFLFLSCAENLDFTQIEDYRFRPVLTVALTYFTVQPFHFFDETGIQQNSRTDITEFDLFQDSFIEENVVKMVFNAEFKNEFDRNASIEIEFLDDNNSIVYVFAQIFVESGDVNPPAYEEELILEDNPNIYNANKIRIRATLENIGTQMNPFDTKEFEFKSSVTLFIDSEL